MPNLGIEGRDLLLMEQIIRQCCELLNPYQFKLYLSLLTQYFFIIVPMFASMHNAGHLMHTAACMILKHHVVLLQL